MLNFDKNTEMTMKITILAASDNNNLQLSKKFEEALKLRSVEVNLVDLSALDLPLYSNPAEKNGVPEVMQSLLKDLLDSNGLMVFAPEYNGGLPPVLTNYIAWISRTGEEFRAAFNSKPAVIGTHSGSGGLHALMALRVQLSYLGMNVLGRQVHTHYKKELMDDTLNDICDRLVSLIK